MECTIDGCTKKVRARGWCGMHYERWRKHGDPSRPKTYTQRGLEARRSSLARVRELSPSHQTKGLRVTMYCQCGKEFHCVPSAAKRRKYCSKSCLARYTTRKPMTQSQRNRIAQAQRERYANDPTCNPFYGRTPTNYQGWGHGQFVDELGFWVRSTWERDYLLALRHAGVTFEYEPQRFDLLEGRGTYMPDIRLGGCDIYVEITGWDKPIKVYKRTLFCEVYGYPLYVIDQKPTSGRIAQFVALCRGVIQDDAQSSPRSL